jgi:hypothetical protein
MQGHVEVTATARTLERVIGARGLALTSFNVIVGAGIFGLPSIGLMASEPMR